jgi:hypothetical protein
MIRNWLFVILGCLILIVVFSGCEAMSPEEVQAYGENWDLERREAIQRHNRDEISRFLGGGPHSKIITDYP